jgi:hypothetical protein
MSIAQIEERLRHLERQNHEVNAMLLALANALSLEPSLLTAYKEVIEDAKMQVHDTDDALFPKSPTNAEERKL